MKAPFKSLIFAFLLIIFVSNANAVSIYLHPGSYFFMAFGAKFDLFPAEPDEHRDDFCHLIYLTVEIPLNLSNSLIIQPSLLYSENTIGTYMSNHKIVGRSIEETYRLGSGIGYRHFLNGEGDGLYLQAMSDIHYYSIKLRQENADKEVSSTDVKKGFYADLLGYIGYSWKISPVSIFLDTGVGVVSPDKDSSRESVMFGLWKNFITYDANFGIGISF